MMLEDDELSEDELDEELSGDELLLEEELLTLESRAPAVPIFFTTMTSSRASASSFGDTTMVRFDSPSVCSTFTTVPTIRPRR